ncbi:teichoic acid glycosylation protein [Enterococcus villorum]|uniref:Teichoic acid glycosylation protein n=1 Tax=Enterococcus villorum TaxID=112904 RepID=A0A1V8YE90_9ENTE|nr:GtrA family protein [Enterococcus villorum]OQO70910.1 teichoic acid glycosylation protein [Enterococcus villorum]OQO74903.1 teichoic acid glycosylation protein [Enterococcus villorum]
MSLYYRFKHLLEEKGYWEIFIYLFFGGLATIVNIVSYAIALQYFKLSMPISNTISWICSALFAFITNKLWVFHSKSPNIWHFIIECLTFLFYRLLSYGMDMGSMLLLIKVMHINSYVAKIITQIIVVIANYVFSKLFVFKETEVIEEDFSEEQK